jgi:hypothetical protein
MNITTYHEFCFILWYYVPKAYDLFLNGQLTSTNSKIGTTPLFYFSPNHTESKEHDWHMDNYLKYYNHNGIIENNIQGWTPPPYNQYFKNDLLVYDKPILTIHNKATIEWEMGLFNFLTTEALDALFSIFNNVYQIIYIRPPHQDTSSYQHDENVKTINIGDFNLIKNKYPNIITIEDLTNSYPDRSYNELQMMALANSDKHITCAGGEAAISSYFGGDVFIYRNKYAPSANRGVWHTDSYLKLFSGSNIIGYDEYDNLIKGAVERWK